MLITSTMCMVLSSWQSHCKSSLGSSDKRRLNTRSRLPTLTLSQPTWAASPPVGCCQPHPPRLFIIYSWRYLLVLVCAEKYLGCCFRGKQCAVDPSSFIGRFYGTFNNILNVMGNSQNEMSAQYLIQTHCLLSLMYSCETRNFEFVWWKSVLKLLGTMLLGKSSMRIGMNVSNHCSIIALLFLYPSCYPWTNCYFGRKCCVVEIWCADWLLIPHRTSWCC